MGLFITRSKANALLDDLEDPVQTIEDATNTLKEYELADSVLKKYGEEDDE